VAPHGLYLLDSPRRGSAAASSPSRVVNSCLLPIYTLEKEAMQEIPAWPRYTGVLFSGHQPYDRRTRGPHPPSVPVLAVEGCVTGTARGRLVLREHRFRERRHRHSESGGRGRPKRRRPCRRCRLLHSLSLPSTRPDRQMISPPAAPVAYSVVGPDLYDSPARCQPALENLLPKAEFVGYTPQSREAVLTSTSRSARGGTFQCGKRMRP